MVGNDGSDIDGYLRASSTGPVKKKRGRPRKNPLPADVAAGDGGDARKAEVVRAPDFRPLWTVQIDEGELSHDYPRPRPALKTAAGPEGVEGLEGTEWPGVKRKRGRPRKNPLAGVEVPFAPVSGPLAGQASAGQAAARRAMAG